MSAHNPTEGPPGPDQRVSAAPVAAPAFNPAETPAAESSTSTHTHARTAADSHNVGAPERFPNPTEDATGAAVAAGTPVSAGGAPGAPGSPAGASGSAVGVSGSSVGVTAVGVSGSAVGAAPTAAGVAPLPAAAKNTCAQCGADAHARCGKCKSVHYCGAECQRSHWPKHKLECKREPSAGSNPGDASDASSDAAAAAAAAATIKSPTELQKAIDDAPEGGVVYVPAGDWPVSLTIKRRVTLQGAGADKSRVGAITITAGGTASKPILCSGMTLVRGMTVSGRVFVVVDRMHISNPGNAGIDRSGGGELVVRGCKISNCEDGILNQDGELSVENTTITNCECDGIFSNPHIRVRDTTIKRVGRHGIKSRGGSTRTGKNDIQPSPWDNPPPMPVMPGGFTSFLDIRPGRGVR